MRTFRIAMGFMALILGNTGCIVACGNRGSVEGSGARQAVVTDDGIYIVNVRTGRFKKLDCKSGDGDLSLLSEKVHDEEESESDHR
ncbi:MAG: hypothetical protein AABZ47_08890 [Planctomycetota bacterium]